jgi:hypothetical protein
MDSDSDEMECNTSSMEDKEVEPCPPSPASASSQTPSSPALSANTSEDGDAVQHSHIPRNEHSPHGPQGI